MEVCVIFSQNQVKRATGFNDVVHSGGEAMSPQHGINESLHSPLT